MQKPSVIASLARLVAGFIFGLTGLSLILQSGWEGIGPSLFFGILLALGGRWFALGVLGMVKPLPPRKQTYAAATVGVLVLTGLGPTLSGAYNKAIEPGCWDRVLGSKDTEIWRKGYSQKVGKPFHRAEYLSRVSEATVAEGLAEKNFYKIRYQAEAAMGKERDKYDDKARQAISAAWRQMQQEGMKNVRPTKLADPEMTGAFKQVLEALAQNPNRQVFLHFEAQGTLEKIPQDTKFFSTLDPKYRSLKVLPVGDAFSPEAHARRSGEVQVALQKSFDSIWPKGMLEVKPAPKEPMADDVHFYVQALVHRIPGFYTNTEAGKITSLLYKCEVAWRFRVVVQGKEAGSFDFRSEPAKHVSYSTKDNDPGWAPYSIVMDSAADNFARLIVGRLGLVPPPVRESYTFSD